MSDIQNLSDALRQAVDVTHVFYMARAEFSDTSRGVEDVEGNARMVLNLLNTVENASDRLKHFHLVEGTKWYGGHLGALPTPSREDDPRHMPPNFYYAQEDALRTAQAGKRWTWSASRPGILYDYAPGRGRNIISTIGVWASMCKELGLPLDFPGSHAAYDSLYEATDAQHLASALLWMVSTPAAENQTFNVTDGEIFRWSRLWPKIAKFYGLEVGIPRQIHLASWMADKGPLWDTLVSKHELQPLTMDQVVNWAFGDFVWGLDRDVISSVGKLRRFGFSGYVDTESQFIDILRRYRDNRILP